MLTDSSVVKLHNLLSVRMINSVSISSGTYEEMELRVVNINGLKAYDIHNELQQLKGLATDLPIRVTRDEGRVYRFYFWTERIQSYDAQFNVRRLALTTLKQ